MNLLADVVGCGNPCSAF